MNQQEWSTPPPFPKRAMPHHHIEPARSRERTPRPSSSKASFARKTPASLSWHLVSFIMLVGLMFLVSILLLWPNNAAPFPIQHAHSRIESFQPQPAQNLQASFSFSETQKSLPVFATSTPLSQFGSDANVPPSVLISDVPINPQERPMNCEFRVASDLLAYYGIAMPWEEIYKAVGIDINGDPMQGFVGSLDAPPGSIYPDGYGVHAPALAQGLQKLGISATAVDNVDMTWLKQQIAQQTPVIVWATSGMSPSQRVTWTTRDNRTVWGVPWEHTFLVVGYDSHFVYMNDPWDGQQKRFSWDLFLSRWSLFDNMALTITAPLP
ncbi:MAG: hypothetical protein D6802_10105 [Ardenticatenia bacterium]|nr:MAG: hypothetical protein D6802_10105 [Ardenticatenia bacterium]